MKCCHANEITEWQTIADAIDTRAGTLITCYKDGQQGKQMSNATMSYTTSTTDDNAVLTTDDAREIARFFQVLADPTRVRMVKALSDSEWCVSELTQALGMDQPAVSHQLKYLRELGLVRWTKTGRHVYYTLADTHLREILMSSIAHLECQP
jgi:ArsR family transcriptional regulator, lead/cadmium/zinc/bismuth-responsive transcriptional repressor